MRQLALNLDCLFAKAKPNRNVYAFLLRGLNNKTASVYCCATCARSL